VLPVSIFRTPGDSAVTGPQVFAPTTAREVRAMLETVTAKGGTSPDAAVPGYRVGGKSGTAYKHAGRGYDKSKYRASFVGMGPMPNPRIVVAVSVDEPTAGSHFGGQVSGPVFSAIVGDTLRSLNVPPDMAVKQMVVSDDPASGTPATDIKKPNATTTNPPKKLKVSANTKTHPGVVR
jgi:cell division protein FtsI (penicillin-binding protein 3)